MKPEPRDGARWGPGGRLFSSPFQCFWFCLCSVCGGHSLLPLQFGTVRVQPVAARLCVRRH
eukprot:8471815-Pyramimonas_sp.AAC.1